MTSLSLKPILSVIFTNYNYGKYLQKSLGSILDQMNENIELIIIDDGSSDSSVEIIDSLIKDHKNIHFYTFKVNQGKGNPFFAADFGIQKAKGSYIFSACSDDMILPTFFEKVLKVLQTDPNFGLVCSFPCYFYGDNTKKINIQKPCRPTQPSFIFPDILCNYLKHEKLYLAGHTTIYSKKFLMPYLKDSYKTGCFNDWFLTHIIGFEHGIYYIPEPLSAMRKHSMSLSTRSTTLKKYRYWASLCRLLKTKKYKKFIPYFKRSAVFSGFRQGFFTFIILHPQHWQLMNGSTFYLCLKRVIRDSFINKLLMKLKNCLFRKIFPKKASV